ncbi:hypothetical protein SAMN03097699_0806 [Flavobacteriaceae bacterium MAR_2010_188]|nr:hypothetical protein SAMN03097699_0806 [Flavobacteriaceae bacterium MAR_2010_188]
MPITITKLYEYPLKSARGNLLNQIDIDEFGLKNDRKIAVVTATGRVITGRERQELLHINSKIEYSSLTLKYPSIEDLNVSLSDLPDIFQASLFRKKVAGKVLDNSASLWISKVLNGNYQLIYFGHNSFDSANTNNEDLENRSSYVDSAPVHLINLKSLEYLNSHLNETVSAEQFRPNLIVDGIEPFEEDTWKEISINGCKFKVEGITERCVFATIDPITKTKNPNLEPLRTIQSLKNSKAVTFGIDLQPLDEAVLEVGQTVEVTVIQ